MKAPIFEFLLPKREDTVEVQNNFYQYHAAGSILLLFTVKYF